MNKIKKVFLLSAVMALTALAGCGREEQTGELSQQAEGLDELKEIQVISREEGSGTRSAFAELAGFLKNDEGKTDLTAEKALIAENAEEVCSLVSENRSSVGYVSLGSLPEDGSVKTLKINGTDARLDEKSYPLSRTFYLTYMGEPSELERDFLTYVHGEGQQIISESYIPVAKSGAFLSGKEKGTLKVGGSTSVAPLMEELAEAYMELNPNAEIVVEATDSGDGLTRTMSGELDFGMSSRDLKDYEMELLDYEAIAKDYIAVIVNPDNPLENITMDALKNIFTGEYVNWKDIVN